MDALARADRPLGRSFGRFDPRQARRREGHPQWWVVLAVSAAWLGLAAAPHAHHHSTSYASWALMCVAMMTPITLPAVRHVYRNSIRSRRQWATVVYLVAYNGVWLGFGAFVLAAAAFVPLHAIGPQPTAVALLVIAGLWQLTRTKTRALRACRRTVPLPPQGRRADAACARFGRQQGWRCWVSCWPLMLLMALVPVHVLVMAVLAAFMYAEERTRLGREMVRQAAALMAVAAIGVAAFG
jgi:predicted metal-binding membrane protein